MKVLFHTRKDFLTRTGGDTVQILKTKQYLEKSGLRVDINTNNSSVEGYDIHHLFNVIPINHVYDFIKSNPKLRIVISPIYWNLDEFNKKVLEKVFFKRALAKLVRAIPFGKEIMDLNLVSKITGKTSTGLFHKKLSFCLNSSQLILPNSKMEGDHLSEEYDVSEKIIPVPNGVDSNIEPVKYDILRRKYNLPDKFLLCVGRIEYRKNQLALLKAARNLGLNVVLVGRINEKERKYNNLLRDYKYIHLTQLTQSELYALYSGALAHVLPSWFETPGLVSLEAAFNGTQIVTTDRGCAKEYFGDHAFYCNPEDVSSVESAIEACLKNPKDPIRLKKIIGDNYTWDIAAKKTMQAYESIL